MKYVYVYNPPIVTDHIYFIYQFRCLLAIGEWQVLFWTQLKEKKPDT